MDLTMAGAGCIAGNLIGRLTFQKTVSDRRFLDVALMCIGLLFIVGSRYHLFGG